MSYENTAETASRLRAWSQNPDYTQGLRLYLELLGETPTYKLLVLSQNSFNVRKLTEALKVKLTELTAAQTEQLSREPATLGELRRRASALMNERTALKAQIRMLKDEAERRLRAFRVLDIVDELDRIYAQIEFFERNNTLWQPEPEVITDDAIVREYLNLRTYISRTAKAYSTAIRPDDQKKLAKKLEDYQKRYAELELTPAVERYRRTTNKA